MTAYSTCAIFDAVCRLGSLFGTVNDESKLLRRLIEKIPYYILIPIALVMLMAPFVPMPHVLEKLIMLKEGRLVRPVDIFDLVYHLTPLAILIVKASVQYKSVDD